MDIAGKTFAKYPDFVVFFHRGIEDLKSISILKISPLDRAAVCLPSLII